MGLFTCCLSGNNTREKYTTACGDASCQRVKHDHAKVESPASPDVRLQASVQIESEVQNVNKHAKANQYSGVPSTDHWRSGLECALALQASLCTAGLAGVSPEARAALLIDVILRHLGASTVRLYVIGSDGSGSGVDDSLDRPLVPLAVASSTCPTPKDKQAAADGAFEPARPPCPLHEAVGTSSALLRRALVGKVATIHRTEAKREGRLMRDRGSSATSATMTTAATVATADESVCGGDAAMAKAAAATAPSRSSTYSCTQPEGDGSRGGPISRCCPDFDLCEADAVPGSAMIFAAVPLAYGQAPFGVLWIALPCEPKHAATSTAGPSAERQQQQRPSGVSGCDGGGGGSTAAASSAIAVVNHHGSHSATPRARSGAGGVLDPDSNTSGHLSGPVGLLSCPSSLQHLALSVSMALAAGAADPPTHFRRLAVSMSRIAGAASLAELIGGLCGALVRHVRQRFLIDAAAQAALVPSPESHVAFMLRPEYVENGAGRGGAGGAASASGAGGQCVSSVLGLGSNNSHLSNSFSAWAARQHASQLQTQTLSRLRMSSIPSSSSAANLMSLAAERSRSVTVANNQQAAIVAASATVALRSNRSHIADLPRAYATVACPDAAMNATAAAATAAAAAMACATVVGGAGGGSAVMRPWSMTTLRAAVPRDVFMLDSSMPRSDVSYGLMSSVGGPAVQPPTLSARAFRLSNTLLQAMLQEAAGRSRYVGASEPGFGGSAAAIGHAGPGGGGAAAARYGGGVLPGVCVCDCARHVQDERQPNRDVCMLMMAAGPESTRAGGGAGGSTGHGHGAGGGRGAGGLTAVTEPGVVAGSSGGSGSVGSTGGGAQSLVLLGIGTGDGAVLAVYLAFPTPEPQQLLEGVRDSCRALLAKVLADVVRHRLHCPDLAAEWDTLRAGVPGSYLSISRGSAAPPDITLGGGPGVVSPASVVLTTAGAAVAAAGPGGGPTPPLSPQPTNIFTVPLRGSTYGDTGMSLLQHASTVPVPGPLESPPRDGAMVPGVGAPTSPPVIPGARAAGGTDAGMRRLSHGGPAMPLLGGVGSRSRKSSTTSQGFTEEASGSAARGRRPNTGTTSTTGLPLTPRSISGRALQLVTRLSGRNSTTNAVNGGDGPTTSPTNCPRSPLDSAGSNVQMEGREDEVATVWGLDGMGAGGGAGTTGAAAAMLTVHDLDETYESWGMRAHLGALVESIISTTLRSSGAHCRVDDAGQGGDTAAARVTEGLEELQLSAVLGQGASGVVLRGTLGCAPVAVKIMEMPDADAAALPGNEPHSSNALLPDSNETDGADPGAGHNNTGNKHQQQHPHEAGGGGGAAGEGQQPGGDGQVGGTGVGGQSATPHEPREVRARRALLRNAMEVAMMRSISHVNIVQAFGVYDNVIMERHEGRPGIISLRRVNHHSHHNNDLKLPEPSQPGVPKSSPICTAIVMQLCDRGSLADALHSRVFPALPLPPPHPSASPAATAGAAMQYARYWKGVHMTLLEMALALRHLHSRRLVHRDLKPGNVLLKSSPGDPRGWTCKLADFGFALVLDRVDTQDDTSSAGSGSVAASALPQPLSAPAGHGPGGGGGGVGPSRDWYAVQQHLGGTVTHMAPEAFRKGARIDASVDVFSFGIIMWELVSSRGHRPYREMELDAISAAVTAGARPFFPPGDQVPLPYRQLAKSCWAAEPRMRPTAAELVSVVKGMLEAVKA